MTMMIINLDNGVNFFSYRPTLQPSLIMNMCQSTQYLLLLFVCLYICSHSRNWQRWRVDDRRLYGFYDDD